MEVSANVLADKRLQSGFGFGGPFERVIPSSLNAAIPPTEKSEAGSDAHWMKEALVESLRGAGITNPNPAVGCVIVKNGQEIARGFTQVFRGKHAERMAFETIATPADLEGATAYVTLEPCSHQGNQPPCVNLLTHSPISRVVIGRGDPDPRVNGEGFRRLQTAGKQVSIGVYSPEITAWNFPFFASKILNRPIFALKWAQTLDGQLADDSGNSKWITGPAARAYTHWMRQRYDAILVGAGTVLSDLPKLSVRDCSEPIQRQPMRIVLDPKGRCFWPNGEQQKVLKTSTFAPDCNTLILTTPQAWENALPDWRRWLDAQSHLRIISIPELAGEKLAETAVDALISRSEVNELLGRPLQSVMVEGGASVLSEFTKKGLGDILHTFISPRLSGGVHHRVSPGKTLSEAHPYFLAATARLGDDLLMEMVPQSLAEKVFT